MAEEQEQKTGEENTPNGGTVTMSQSEFDEKFNHSFGKGAAKGEEKAIANLLSNLGVDDIDVLKSVVTEYKEGKEASKTELQKLQEMLEAERMARADIESKLNENEAEFEIQTLALANGINPAKIKYFKIDYLEAKTKEGFDPAVFIEELKGSQPDFFGFIDERKTSVPNPKQKGAATGQISMADYVRLPAAERKKYKASDIIR